MNTKTNSPTPWTVAPLTGTSIMCPTHLRDGIAFESVAETVHPEDAALIVTAVNSHASQSARIAELEGALRDYLESGATVATDSAARALLGGGK